MKKVLVAGATGYLGRYLVQELKKEYKMTKENFIEERTRIISELLNNRDEQNTNPTTKCFEEFDKLYDKIVTSDSNRILDKVIELIKAKKINPPSRGNTYNEPIKIELIKANKNNPHSLNNNYNELIKYDAGLDDAIEIINGLYES